MTLPTTTALPMLSGEHGESLAPFDAAQLWSQWELAPAPVLAIAVGVVLYVGGVRALHRRGDRWPVGRSLAFGFGMAAFLVATTSGIAVYDTTLLSVHMVQHMVLSMLVPLSLALSAPITLALRTLPAPPRRWLLVLLHSPVAKVLAFAPLAFALYVLSPWALYFTGWYDASLHSGFIHEAMHLHLVAVGTLFFWPLMGIDPLPGRVDYPFRVLLTVLTLPFHAFLGVTIMGQSTLIGHEWYPELSQGPMGSWLPDPFADQQLAGGILWGSGDLIGIAFFVVLFVQWVRSSKREAVREDRRLDRIEARDTAGR